MPRRRLEPPPADRLAGLLGIPNLTSSTALPTQEPAGWVPKRAAVIRPPLISASAGSSEAISAAMTPSPGRLDIGRHRRPAPPKPAILTVPLALRGVRAKPRRLAVLGVLVVLLAVAGVFGVRVAWALSLAKPAPIAATAHGLPGGLVTRSIPAAFAPTRAADLPAPARAVVLLVHVVGQVRRPGVIRLPAGARVLDAVKAAGGARPSADLNHLNLARPVADGEQILVPRPGEAISASGASGASGVSGASGSVGKGPSVVGSTGGGLVDLNTADASALDSLPGVGPVLSQRILDWRTQHGRFSSVDELGEVSGIGDKLLAQIRPKVKV